MTGIKNPLYDRANPREHLNGDFRDVAEEARVEYVIRMPEGKFPSRSDGAEAGIVTGGIHKIVTREP